MLLLVQARQDASGDPYDVNYDFVPDGSEVFSQSGYSLAPGGKLDVQFSVSPDARNWSFEISYEYKGDFYDELIAVSLIDE